MRARLSALSLLLAAACSTTTEDRRTITSGSQPRAVPPSPPIALEGTAFDAASRVELPKVPPAEAPGLHNVYQLSDDIISGSEPEGAEALAEIASWGVKTILSVDGKVPDAATAERLGMRYVHVPIQYSGIDDDELLDIAKTFRELPGPFYVHCYHGQHRGPAAAAVGRVVVDGVPRERAIAEMRQWCATDSKYEGLYAAIATKEMPEADQTTAWKFDFTPAHEYEGLRAGMVELGRKWDLVKDAKGRQWAADPAHPDVDALQEATQLHQIFAACAGLDEVRTWPDDFRAWVEDGRGGSEALLRALSSCTQEGVTETAWRADADTAYARVSNACSACHKAYRD